MKMSIGEMFRTYFIAMLSIISLYAVDYTAPNVPPVPTVWNNANQISKDIDLVIREDVKVSDLIHKELQWESEQNRQVIELTQSQENELRWQSEQNRQLMELQTALKESQEASQKRQEFLMHVVAFAISFISGFFTWRLVILAKNQRNIW